MSWKDLKDRKESSNSDFIKLKDGQEVQGVFMGEPYTFYQKFKDSTEHKDWSEGRTWRFRVNFIVKNEAGEYEAKILTGGAKISDQIVAYTEEEGMDGLYKIKRSGSGKDDTVYTVHFKGKVPADQFEKLKSIPLKNLIFNKSTSLRGEPPSDDDTVPF